MHDSLSITWPGSLRDTWPKSLNVSAISPQFPKVNASEVTEALLHECPADKCLVWVRVLSICA